MRGLKALLFATALLSPLTMASTANAQVQVVVGIQPTCSYGYYDYSPYACAPVGFYGPGYFYNGIFLGMGPWAGWGYGHGWGSHRFVSGGGGHYNGNGGYAANHGSYGGGGTVHANGNGGYHAQPARGESHAAPEIVPHQRIPTLPHQRIPTRPMPRRMRKHRMVTLPTQQHRTPQRPITAAASLMLQHRTVANLMATVARLMPLPPMVKARTANSRAI